MHSTTPALETQGTWWKSQRTSKAALGLSLLEMTENFTHDTIAIWLPKQDLNKDCISRHADMEREPIENYNGINC